LYAPKSENDGSTVEPILCSSGKKEQENRDEEESSIRGMSCKSIERLTSVTYFVAGFETDLKPFSGSLCPRV